MIAADSGTMVADEADTTRRGEVVDEGQKFRVKAVRGLGKMASTVRKVLEDEPEGATSSAPPSRRGS